MEEQKKLIESVDNNSFLGVENYKEIYLNRIRYGINTLEGKKLFGVYSKIKDYYVSYRRRYTKDDGVVKGHPNFGRPKHKQGHFFEKYNGYGISDFISKNRNEESLFIICEDLVQENKKNILICDFGKVKSKGIKWVDKSMGNIDLQLIVPIEHFKVIKLEEFTSLMIESK